MTTSTPLSYSDLTEGSPGNEDEESIGHGLPPHVEQSCYRSGLMDFSSPGEKPREGHAIRASIHRYRSGQSCR